MPITLAEAQYKITGPGGLFELTEQNVLGTTLRTYSAPPHTLRDVLLMTRDHGAKDYLIYEDERYTFAEFFEVVAQLADWLVRENNVSQGERVAISMRNYPEFVIFFWACQAIGAIVVPLNAWWTASELAFALEDCGAVVLVADGERIERLEAAIGESTQLRTAVSVRTDRRFDRVTPWETVKAALKTVVDLPEVELSSDDLATIVYTSGTTSRARGVMHSHRNHCTNVVNALALTAVTQLLAEDSESSESGDKPQGGVLAQMPLFHITQLATLYMNAVAGAKVALMTKWDVEKALDLIERERLTAFVGVPLQAQDIFDSPGLVRRDLSSLERFALAATTIPPEQVRRVEQIFHGKVIPISAYGMTEATTGVTFIGGAEYLLHPHSVGRPLAVVDVKIVDEHGNRVRMGDAGELWVRGPNVSRGYWNLPAETAAAFTDGWHHSGDVAHFDDAGLLYIVDRIKDVVIRAGENIHTGEVEHVLYEAPSVHTAVVFGIPHPRFDEELVAVVRLSKGYESTSAEQLQQHVACHLAHFKVPSRIFFIDGDMPRTETGKVVKRFVRRQLLEEIDNGSR
ncbi:class I adenylate-forming enzyme family protein [uncultured Microbacterium sp.]|uniref:class I adenylate-forming enzyme family protein n=1 Tax=uncultured Microbacterium sp. TaxID=191216 RepID=UPI0035C97AFF